MDFFCTPGPGVALWKQLGKFEAFTDLAPAPLPFPARCYHTGKSFSADGKQKGSPSPKGYNECSQTSLLV